MHTSTSHDFGPITTNTLFISLILFILGTSSAYANNLRIENIAYHAQRESGQPLRAVFDISWDNAWHNERNRDAAWVFLKLQRSNGTYVPVTLADRGHHIVSIPGTETVPGTIQVADDGVGFFLYPEAIYRGNVSWRVSVVFEESAIEDFFPQAQLHVFGLEMVYVPEGPFMLGDPAPEAANYGAYFKVGADTSERRLYPIESENSIAVGKETGNLFYNTGEYQGDGIGPIPAIFPKGFHAFYSMKYELTQGQYASFLNTLSDDATYQRVNFGGRTYFGKRGSIRLEGTRYVASHPDRPMNFLSWDDGLAFADWAGLRPMTEFEFTKASRGPDEPVANAFPWGTSNRDAISRIVNAEDNLVMANGWTEAKRSDETRSVFGASYYWVMDLAGSVWERVITAGYPDGRSFQGTHGDGRVDYSGNATNEDWPHTFAGRNGHGYRGGGFYDQGRAVHEFNPYSPVSYRRFGAWSGADPHRAYGFRCVRTAPVSR